MSLASRAWAAGRPILVPAALIGLMACGGGEAVPGGEPEVPGVQADARLVAHLRHAVEEKGPSYRARTRHLRSDGSPVFTNRLILESSPYLLQHAHNPVNWHAWSEAAFEKARRQQRPVLLSVGYSTCHWCHVMERESFEDEEIARLINERFVAIKVDREERPDVDGLYMTAVQMLHGSGGWPMTVVMTPQREPFFAATYIPPRDGDRGVSRGLRSVLTELADSYATDRDGVVARAAEVSRRIADAL
ncbi:MAG TPA: thioredoxin domain-containing protein, partial [Candidatus Binatia bacterium]|nr:thioredoxin domain-containing protein [Candidatus Binatia bacterium]